MKRYLVFVLFALIASSSCNSDKSGDIDLIFKLRYDGAPLVMFDHYTYPNGVDVFFTRFSFYMANAKAQSASGDIDLFDIEMINLSNSHLDLSGANEGYTLSLKDIPVEDFNALSFEIGVPPDLNSLAPEDFSTDHPLGSSGEYWLGWNSYIFLKIEGKMDLDGDGTFEEGISLHVGSDEVLRSAELIQEFTVSEDSTTDLTIDIDLLDIFVRNSNTYDLIGTPRIHSLEQMDQALEIATNLAESF